MSDTLSSLAKSIEQQFIAGLKGQALTQQEAALVSSVINRLAVNSTLYATADSSIQPAVKAKVDEDLATLENLASAKAINAQTLLRETVVSAMEQFVAFGIKSALAAVA